MVFVEPVGVRFTRLTLGNYCGAVDRLRFLLLRTDGSAPPSDCVIDATAQTTLTQDMNDVIDDLELLNGAPCP